MKLTPGSPLRLSLAFSSQRRIPVGRLALVDGIAALEYAPEFIESRLTINPLFAPAAPGLTYALNPREFDGLHGVFADSLPDAWGQLLVRRRAEAAGIVYSSLTLLDKLAIVGSRGPGALIYEPETSDRSVDGIDLDVDALANESALVIAGRADAHVLRNLERVGGSSGGARPKALIGMNARGEIIVGDGALPPGFDAWIIKFRSSDSDVVDIGPLEAAYAAMARAAGLGMAEVLLLPAHDGKHGYFATKRFDRLANNGRIHMASAAALLDTPWSVPTIDYADLLKLTRFVTRNHVDVERAFDRMVFNVIAHNRDDHAKQHSFLMDDHGSWSLAPAYDLTFSRGPGGEHYLAVGGYGGDDISQAVIEKVGRAQDISSTHIRESITRTLSVVADWSTFARDFGVTPESSKLVRDTLQHAVKRLS